MPMDTSNSFKRSKVSREVLSSSSHDLLSCISSNSSSRDFLKHASHTYSSQLGLLGLDNSKTATTHAESGDWVVVESIVDSGAARSVCPIHFCDSFGTQKPPAGVVEHFKTATGARVPNEGKRTIRSFGDNGAILSTTYSVADIAVPLDSVSQMCDSGSTVIFNKHGGRVIGSNGAVICQFDRKNDTYVRRSWIQKPVANEPHMPTPFVRPS